MCSAFRRIVAVVIAAAGASCAHHAAASASGTSARILRVCADPNNLPYSNQRLEGFENRLATLVGQRLGASIEYTWWAQRRGFIRNTLRAGTCDVVMGLPSKIEQAATTEPYYRSSYVFVTRRGAHHPASFDDPLLASARIGAHIIGDDFANSPPAHALSKRGFIDNLRGYSVYGDYNSPNPPAALITAVVRGDVDVAIAWGPLAGYFARFAAIPLELTRVTPDEEPPFPFVFDMSMAVAHSNQALRDELNHMIASSRPEIDAILRAYAVPLIEPHKVASR